MKTLSEYIFYKTKVRRKSPDTSGCYLLSRSRPIAFEKNESYTAKMKSNIVLLVVVCTCVVIVTIHNVDSTIVGAFVLPHGGIALDPRNFNTTNKTKVHQAYELQEACLKVGRDVRRTNPDLIFLSTPHGMADYRNFLIYSNIVGSGRFYNYFFLPMYTVQIIIYR